MVEKSLFDGMFPMKTHIMIVAENFKSDTMRKFLCGSVCIINTGLSIVPVVKKE